MESEETTAPEFTEPKQRRKPKPERWGVEDKVLDADDVETK